MPLILPGNVASATAEAYTVDNSCRFDLAGSASMSATQAAEGNRDSWTFSAWVKRGNITTGATQQISCSYQANVNNSLIAFNTDDSLQWDERNNDDSTLVGEKTTNAKFRDPSAWYHIVYIWDSGNATSADRMQIWVNGVRITSFASSTDPGSDQDAGRGKNAGTVTIGRWPTATGVECFDGYMAEVVFLDGAVASPVDTLGQFNEDSPSIWEPIDPSGLTFGDEGYYLDFGDSAALGDDVSGNSNDFTEENLAAADQATDTPTNNFATLNPLLKSVANPTVLSEGNCKSVLVGSSNADWAGGSTIGLSAGKWYWEIKVPTLDTALIGITDNPAEVVRSSVQELTYDVAIGYGYTAKASGPGSGYKRINEAGTQVDSAYGDTYDNTDIIGVALNIDDLELKFYKDNVVQNSGTAIDIIASTNSGFYFPAATKIGTATSTFEFNFGGCPAFALASAESDENGYGNFEYAPPSGFLAICTKNLGSDGG